MLTKIIKDFKLNVGNLYLQLATVGGIWLAFFTLAMVICLFNPGEAYPNLGILIAIIFGAVLSLLYSVSAQSAGFSMAVSMGQTRKAYAICTSVNTFAYNLISLALIGVLAVLDSTLARLILPNLSHDEAFINMTPKLMLWGVGVCLALALVSLFISAMIIRFGKMVMYIFWVAYFAILVFGSTIGDMVSAADPSTFGGGIIYRVAGFFTSLSMGGILAICSILVLGAWVAGFGLLRRASIK